MPRTITRYKALIIALIVLLITSPASPVAAGVNVWTSQGPEGGIILSLAIDPSTPNTTYTGINPGGMFKSIDGGINWNASSTGLPYDYGGALVIGPQNPATLYAGQTGNGVYRSTDGGASWSEFNDGLTTPYVECLVIHPTNHIPLYAGTMDEGLFVFQEIVYRVNLPLILW